MKIFYRWGIVCAGVIVIAGLYVFLPKGVPTTTFSDTLNGIHITYPTSYGLREEYEGGFDSIPPTYNVLIDVPATYQQGTDFQTGRVIVSMSTSTKNCFVTNDTSSMLSATKNIHGVEYRYDPKQPLLDAAMGGVRGVLSYFYTQQGGYCYRIEKIVVYRDLHGFKDPPYAPHFDEVTTNTDLDAIVESVRLK